MLCELGGALDRPDEVGAGSSMEQRRSKPGTAGGVRERRRGRMGFVRASDGGPAPACLRCAGERTRASLAEYTKQGPQGKSGCHELVVCAQGISRTERLRHSRRWAGRLDAAALCRPRGPSWSRGASVLVVYLLRVCQLSSKPSPLPLPPAGSRLTVCIGERLLGSSLGKSSRAVC